MTYNGTTNAPAQRNDNRPAVQKSNILELKRMLGSESVKKRFEEMLGKKAPQFTASIVNAVSRNAMLKMCTVESVIGAAYVAATYDLPIDSNLGFAAIVPYANRRQNPETKRWETVTEAQFQMMYKGFIQLAIRSGCYKKMNYSIVYQDELTSYNPITGEVEFVDDFSKCTQRASGDRENIAGYYAWFELATGFRHDLYMSTEEVKRHALKYSKSFQRDQENKKESSRWSTDFEQMALKTVIKLLLSRWAILTIDMQRAIEDDQKVFDGNGNGDYSDNRSDDEAVEDPFGKADEIVVDAHDVSAHQMLDSGTRKNAEKQQVEKPAHQAQPQRQEEYTQYEDDFADFDESSKLPWE